MTSRLAGELRLEEWRYRPFTGEAAPPVDDRGWLAADPELRSGATPVDWSGAGWIAIDLAVPPQAVGRTLALRLPRHLGASRWFVDGLPIGEIGTPTPE